MAISTLGNHDEHGEATGCDIRLSADACRRKQCSECQQQALCLSCAQPGNLAGDLDALVSARLHIRRGEPLCLAGDAFKALYVVHGGFFKSYVISEDGREQVTGFHMAGELIGMDGIDTEQHSATIVALEDSHVCVIPYASLVTACARLPGLQHRLLRAMSGEIVRSQGLSLLLGSMRAEERVITFLLNLSQRLAERGYSATEFHLRMTREEIGSYLGLKLETVSRIFSRFQELGWALVNNKHIRLLDLAALAASIDDIGQRPSVRSKPASPSRQPATALASAWH